MPDTAAAGGGAGPFDELLAANARYAESFELGDLQAIARRGLAVVTCFDSRIEPLQMLGLAPGDAKILRVAGGRVSEDVLGSLALATSRLGVTRIAVVQHTDCAAPDIGDDTLHADVRRIRAAADIDAVVAGFRYDVRSGRLTQVVAAAAAAAAAGSPA